MGATKHQLHELTDTTFDETIAGATGPVVVDFWAEWCGPCKQYTPVLEEVAREHPELTVVALNTDEQPQTAMRFDVMSVPTVIVFRDGEAVKRFVGARGKGRVLEDLADFLA
jgi:thioredoxin 1